MSDSLKFNALLVAIMLTLAVAVSQSIVTPQTYLIASPYCSEVHVAPVDAHAAYAIDILTGEVIYDVSGDAQLPLASITKTATALTALDVLGPDALVVISRDALSVEGNSGLTEGETWRVKDLVDFTLIESSNDGARALRLAVDEALRGSDTFIDRMNELARRIPLSQTYFINESGLDVSSTTAGAYGSARDIAQLLRYAFLETNGALEGSSSYTRTIRSLGGNTHDARHTSDIASLVEGVRISKTGYTDLAGGNLAIVFDAFPGQPVAAVILGSTRDERDEVMARFADDIVRSLRIQYICDSYSGHYGN